MKRLILLLIFYYSLFITHYSFSQWVQVSNGMGINRCVWVLTSSGNDLYACTDSTIFRSTNNGQYWFAISNNPNFSNVEALVVYDNNIFAGTWNGVYHSTNYGNSWTYKGLQGNVKALALYGQYLFASTVRDSSRIYYSQNYGNTWVRCTFPNLMVCSFAVNTFIFASTWTGGVYRLNNQGLNWYSVNNGLPVNYGGIIFAKNEDLYTSVFPGGVYRSTNYGGNWFLANNGLGDSVSVYSYAVKNEYIFVGIGGKGIFLSTNDGNVWVNKNYGSFKNSPLASILIFNNYVFVGTGDSSVWRRSLSEIIGINKISKEIPNSFSLHQNYPNPFNPNTIIRFQIKDLRFVSLKIFDVLGKEISTLVDEKLNAGTYEVTFDGGNLPSGIYFYKLEVENFSDVKKMVLIK